MRTSKTPVLLVGLFSLAAGPIAWGQFAPPPPTGAQQPYQTQQYPAQTPQYQAQSNPYPTTAAILVSQTDVSSGPGQQYFATSRLRYGERVVVLGESKKGPGWMEILPPPGSFSWIDARYVKVVPGMEKIGIVDTGDPKVTAPILPGSALGNKEPSVEIARAQNGTQLFLLDRPSATAGGSWYPIAPVATEVRFLPAEAVRGSSYAGNTYPGTTVGYNPAPTNPYAFVQLSQQADQALASGNIERAQILYSSALNQTTDPAWRNYISGQLARISGTPAGTLGKSVPGSTLSLPAPPAGAAPVATAGQKQWSPWGVLRSPKIRREDGQSVFVLTDPKNGVQPLMYVTTAPGFALDSYLNQTIAVYGTLTPQVDQYINVQILVAEHVATPPPTK